MARVILGTSMPQVEVPALSIRISAKIDPSLPSVESRLRQRRSMKYIEFVQQLQAARHKVDSGQQDELIKAIREEFPEISISAFPLLGLVFRARPGYPRTMPTSMIAEATSGMMHHVLHSRLQQKVNVIDAQEYDDAVMQACTNYSSLIPGFYSRAFNLVEHQSYAFVEIYPEYLIAISNNGETSLVRGA